MRKPNKGFTLIEIMVVIVIAAVLISAVALSFPPVGDKLLKENADRFSALMSLAQDEAILQSTELAVEITPNGYSFYQNESNSWATFSDPPFIKRQLPAEISTKLYIDGISIDLKDRDEDKPQVVILSSGEMTPFTYTLQFKNQSEIKLKADANGEIEKTFSQLEPATQ
ncbi:MAG: type II secretion system minor pseudopilin GspH [Cocleimonas sp.]